MKYRLFNSAILFILFSAVLAVYTFDGLSVRAKSTRPLATKAVSAAGVTAAVADDDDDDFEFRGVIEALPNTAGFIGDWTVSGRKVHVSAATKIDHDDGQVMVGANRVSSSTNVPSPARRLMGNLLCARTIPRALASPPGRGGLRTWG